MSREIGDWIETYTGKKFWPLDPDAEDVDIWDIAHSLSLKCRFGGHCREFYSVAQHSVIVTEALAEYSSWYKEWNKALLAALLHDAGESYFCDIPRPVKRHMKELKDIENKIVVAVYNHFNLDLDELENISNNFIGANLSLKKDVKRADNVALATEARDLMKNSTTWNMPWIPLDEVIVPLGPKESEVLFINKYKELIN